MRSTLIAMHVMPCMRILARRITAGWCRTLRLGLGLRITMLVTVTIAMRVGGGLRRVSIAGRCKRRRCGLGCGRLFRRHASGT